MVGPVGPQGPQGPPAYPEPKYVLGADGKPDYNPRYQEPFTLGGVRYERYSDGTWKQAPGVGTTSTSAGRDNSGQIALIPDGSGNYGYVTYGPNGADFARTPDGRYIVAKPASASGPNGGQGFAPSHDAFTDQRTGDRVFTTNGVETSRIAGASWASLSPAEQFAQTQQVQQQADDAAMKRQMMSDTIRAGQAATTEAGINNRFGIEQGGINNRFGVEQAGINDRFGYTYADKALMDRAQLAENARQANLQSATNAFGDVTRAAPQLGQLALDNAKFTKDTLSSAPDYLARAYFQQGQTSPLPQVSQADIINQLRNNIQGFNTTLQGFNPGVGAYVPPGAARQFGAQGAAAGPMGPMGPVTPPEVANQILAPALVYPGAGGSGTSGSGGGGGSEFTPEQLAYSGPSPADLWAAAGGTNDAPAAAFGTGGFTREPMMRVGDSPNGAPNATEEMVINPTGAPIGVVPNPQTVAQQGQQGSQARPSQPPMKDPTMVANDAKVKALSKIMGFVEKPETLHAIVDELTAARAKTKKEVPGFANGTGLFGFSIPELPSPLQANQQDIQSLERSVRPPALNALFTGQQPGEPRFGFNLFTPNQLGSLTPEDRTALGTTLATQYNENMPNVEAAIKRRWSTGNSNTATLGGF